MQIATNKLARAGVLSLLVFSVGAAQAHTGHGTTSLMEGLIHPLGADHLLAMVAVGVWSVAALPAGKAWQGPATFMLALIVSAALGALGATVPYLESLIALSVVAFGSMLVLRNKLPPSLGLGLIALAASMHGLAHGAETPATGFAAYAAGFMLVTATLHGTGVAMALALQRSLAQRASWGMSAMGALFGGAGVYLLSQV